MRWTEDRFDSPFFQAIPKFRMIAAQHDDEICPALGKYLACVPVQDDATLRCERLELIK